MRFSSPFLRNSDHRRRCAIAILAAAVALGVGSASVAEKPSAPMELGHYANLVEELDLRRRVNVLFPNPQSLLDGLQVGFVNISTGNLK